MYNLDYIEKKQNIKLPEEYKQLYQSSFKEFGSRLEIHVNEDIFCIIKFLSASEINDTLDEFYDFFGYDIVPIAETEYEDYICLNYRDNAKNPTIIYWDYELVLEGSTEGISVLYGSIHEFITNLLNFPTCKDRCAAR